MGKQIDGMVSSKALEALKEHYKKEQFQTECNLFRLQGAIAILDEILGEHITEPDPNIRPDVAEG